MNLTRYINRTSHVGLSFFDSSFKVYEKKTLKITKNVALSFFKTYCKNGSLTYEGNVFPKKRFQKKKKLLPLAKEGFQIVAFSTAEEYNLENLSLGLPDLTAFKPTSFGKEFVNTVDVLHATSNSENMSVCKDLFFFRDGCVVMWNMLDSEVVKILDFLKNYEDNSFKDDLVKNESEVMTYSVSNDIPQTQIVQDCLLFSTKGDIRLEKYTISNAMALSVHLGTYESSLEQYIHTMEPVTEDLKSGNKIKMSRSEVLQKTGQLFALRHNINLNSDLLDTPDFYWDREDLETLYQIIFNYFCISKRTRVINEKINHCIELVELLSSHLNDKHHIRLEWMIIILIMVEVGFEVCHYVDRLPFYDMVDRFLENVVFHMVKPCCMRPRANTKMEVTFQKLIKNRGNTYVIGSCVIGGFPDFTNRVIAKPCYRDAVLYEGYQYYCFEYCSSCPAISYNNPFMVYCNNHRQSMWYNQMWINQYTNKVHVKSLYCQK